MTTLFTTDALATIPPAATRVLLMWYDIIGPGVRVKSPATLGACCPGLQFTHVLAGAFTLRVDGPLHVIHADGVERVALSAMITPGTEVVLQSGDTAIVAVDLATTFGNPGTDPVHLGEERLVSRLSPPPT